MKFDMARVAEAIRCPLSNVEKNWPIFQSCLDALYGPAITRNIYIAALATLAVETAHTFKSVREYGSDALHERMYGHRRNLGNLHDGDGAKYAGKGPIQLTGEINYEHYGKLFGVDLVNHPELAFKDDVCDNNPLPWMLTSAFLHEHKIDVPANAGDWARVRKIVNGGYNGLEDFMQCVTRLQKVFND